MFESIGIGVAVLLILVPVGVATWWGLLRLMDKAGRINFIQTADKIESDPLAAAVYFGLRAVAAASLVGALFSRFV